MSEKDGGASQPIKIPNYARFLLGCFAGSAATCFTQPLDLVKNRMQMTGVGGRVEHKTTFHFIYAIITKEGFFELYNGLSAGIFRQATYTTARLGTYSFLIDNLKPKDAPPNFILRFGSGCFAGAVAGFIGCPADVAMIRMCSDGRLPPAERRNYKWVGEALFRIRKEEGIAGLWTGALPTTIRSIASNAALLSTYSQSKEYLISTGYFEDNINAHFWASMCAGLVCSVVALPLDITKTRIQNMPKGKPEYTGMVDVLVKVIRFEGVPALWKGFTPYYARLGPQTVLTFVFLEQFTTWYRRYILGDKTGVGTGF